MIGLGGLPGSYGSFALGVSADGLRVVGRISTPEGVQAFQWRQASGMVGMGDLAGGSFSSTAYAVSADGSIIAGEGRTASGRRPFVWNTGQGMRDLQALLVDHFGLNLAGWQLREAKGLSADGRTIVGGGINSAGTTEGWRVVFTCAAPFEDDDADGDVDLSDFARFSVCATGEGDGGVRYDPFLCGCFDTDRDRDVDVEDLSHLESALTGPSV